MHKSHQTHASKSSFMYLTIWALAKKTSRARATRNRPFNLATKQNKKMNTFDSHKGTQQSTLKSLILMHSTQTARSTRQPRFRRRASLIYHFRNLIFVVKD